MHSCAGAVIRSSLGCWNMAIHQNRWEPRPTGNRSASRARVSSAYEPAATRTPGASTTGDSAVHHRRWTSRNRRRCAGAFPDGARCHPATRTVAGSPVAARIAGERSGKASSATASRPRCIARRRSAVIAGPRSPAAAASAGSATTAHSCAGATPASSATALATATPYGAPHAWARTCGTQWQARARVSRAPCVGFAAASPIAGATTPLASSVSATRCRHSKARSQ